MEGFQSVTLLLLWNRTLLLVIHNIVCSHLVWKKRAFVCWIIIWWAIVHWRRLFTIHDIIQRVLFSDGSKCTTRLFFQFLLPTSKSYQPSQTDWLILTRNLLSLALWMDFAKIRRWMKRIVAHDGNGTSTSLILYINVSHSTFSDFVWVARPSSIFAAIYQRWFANTFQSVAVAKRLVFLPPSKLTNHIFQVDFGSVQTQIDK